MHEGVGRSKKNLMSTITPSWPLVAEVATLGGCAHPKRYATLAGMPAFGGHADKVKEAFDSELFPLKYTCTLTTKSGMMFSAVVVSHLELSDYLLMKGFEFFTLDKPVELALNSERSVFG
jgi:hypothetical protein